MTEKPHNKKSPEGPQQSKRANPEYPWVSGQADVNGHYKIKYADPENPNTSFIEEVYHDGSFSIKEVLDNDNKGMRNDLYHHHREYGLSKSSHHDGNMDVRAYNKSVVTDKDHGLQIGGNRYKGIGGKEIKVTNETNKTRSGSKGSNQPSYHSSSGDVSHMFEGNYFAYYEKDHGQMFGGSQYTISSNGDIGTHVQKGNYDTLVSGKIQHTSGDLFNLNSGDKLNLNSSNTMKFESSAELYMRSKNAFAIASNSDVGIISAKKDITIVSNTKITIIAGNSRIEITPSGIALYGATIDFNKSS